MDIYYTSNVSKEVRHCSDNLFIAMAFQKLTQVTREVTGQQGSVVAVQLLQEQSWWRAGLQNQNIIIV